LLRRDAVALLFGIATLRAGILSRCAARLLIVAPLVAPVAALLPGELQRIAAVPMGIALAWLGYALWSERREQAVEIQDRYIYIRDEETLKRIAAEKR
jgi:hypothetical protein